MKKFLIDVNLPYYFSLWNTEEYIHLKDINDEWKDEIVWKYAKENSLTIISKDSDFSNMILFNEPPPRVIHIKFGNMKMKEFYERINSIWNEVLSLNQEYKLVNVFKDRIEGIK